jgi:hypothetical protein
MSKTVNDYLNLITSEHRNKPNFIATVEAAVAPLVQIQTLLEAMIDLFDIDMTPVGDQLDIIGQWVGASRKINSAFAGIYFTWDDTDSDGWDMGIWQQPGAPAALVILPDDVYLTYIKAKIALNSWDGTTEGAYRIWAEVLPQYNLMFQDNQDMSFIFAISGTPLDSLTKALVVGGYLPMKPEGIRISDFVFPVDTNPLFAWDCESAGLGGWDEGSWGEWVAPT